MSFSKTVSCFLRCPRSALLLPLSCILPFLWHYFPCPFSDAHISRVFSAVQGFVLEGSFGWTIWSVKRIYCPNPYRPYQRPPFTHLLVGEYKVTSQRQLFSNEPAALSRELLLAMSISFFCSFISTRGFFVSFCFLPHR